MTERVDKVPYNFFYGPTNHRYLDRYDAVKADLDNLVDKWSDILEGVYTSLDELIARVADPDFYPPPPAAPGAPRPPVLPGTPQLKDLSRDIPPFTAYPTVGDYNLPVTLPLGPLDLPPDPSLLPIGGVTPNMPAAPRLPPIDTTITPLVIPEFASDIVLITPPLPPTTSLPDAPVPGPVPPIDTDIPDLSTEIDDIPPMPPLDISPIDEDLYTVPGLELPPVNVPDIPQVGLPGLEEPETLLSCVYNTLCMSLGNMLVNAQLDAEYEQVSMEQVLAREAEAADAALRGLPAQWAARGFMLPPGAMMDADTEIRRGMELRAKEGSREIYTKRRELELQTRTAALSAGTQLYSAEAEVHNLTQRLLLEQRQFIATQAMRNYELALRAADLQMAQLTAHLAVFNAEVEAQKARWGAETQKTQQKLANAELYTANIRGIEAQASVAKTEMEMYRTRVEAQSAAANALLERDRLLFDTWKVQVDVVLEEIKAQSVYADILRGQASAMTAEATAYQAQVGGLTAQTDSEVKRVEAEARVQQTVVQLYSAQVDSEGVRTKVLLDSEAGRQAANIELLRFLTAKSTALASHSEAGSRIRSSEVSASAGAYQANVSAIGAVANSQMGMYNAVSAEVGAQAQAQQTDIALYRASLDSVNEVYKVEAQANSDGYRQALSAWTSSLQQKTTYYNLLVSKLGFVGQYPAEIIRSGMSSQLVSLSTGEQFKYDQSNSYSATLTNRKADDFYTNTKG